ncbi:hypothetical protein ASF74_05435 [Arthrobacter sp. Leaf145]|nr:hypothetical protein ASF74_05435 [Arthrobacter sp. Leaf145]
MSIQFIPSNQPNDGDIQRDILDLLGILGGQLSARSSLGQYIAADLERACMSFLNIAYSSSSKTFIDANGKFNNFPVADLTEADEKLAVQVTLRLNHQKLKDTKSGWLKHKKPGEKLDGYQELWVIGMIIEEKRRLRSTKQVKWHPLERVLNLRTLDRSQLDALRKALMKETKMREADVPDVRDSIYLIIKFLNRPAVYLFSDREISWVDSEIALRQSADLIHHGIKREGTSDPIRWVLPLPKMPPSVQDDLNFILEKIHDVRGAIAKFNPKPFEKCPPIDIARLALRDSVNALATNNGFTPPFREVALSSAGE